ncbi:hypothetical protein LIA77_04950 [Sarocladium implicatum]|nr:hypothetical protein LIA77_04950 [Sarocladium implicatum]
MARLHSLFTAPSDWHPAGVELRPPSYRLRETKRTGALATTLMVNTETIPIELSDVSQGQSDAVAVARQDTRTTSNSSFRVLWNLTAQTYSKAAWCALRLRSTWLWIQSNRGAILLAGGTFVGAMVATIALKPAFEGQNDSERALALAEWTALKDFLSYCWDAQDSQELSDDCKSIIDEPLPPPPHFDKYRHKDRLVKRLPRSVAKQLGLRTRQLKYMVDLETVGLLTAAYLSVLCIWILVNERSRRQSRGLQLFHSQEASTWCQMPPWISASVPPKHHEPPPRMPLDPVSHTHNNNHIVFPHQDVMHDVQGSRLPSAELDVTEIRELDQGAKSPMPLRRRLGRSVGTERVYSPHGWTSSMRRSSDPDPPAIFVFESYDSQLEDPCRMF